MKTREPEPLPEHIFPVDPWRLVERRFDRNLLDRTETLFAVANGYLGMRGNPEEGRPVHDHGTFVNGFHETWEIVHAEEAYGLAKTGQTIIDAPDAKIIKLYVDDEPLHLHTATLRDYERALDMRTGVLRRTLLWETPSGKEVRVTSTRLASTRHRHLCATRYEVQVTNADAPVVISSQLLNRQDTKAPDDPNRQQFDPRTTRTFDHHVLERQSAREGELRVIAGYRTANSRMTLGVGMDHVIDTNCEWQATRETSENLGKVIFTIPARQGCTIRIDKFASYHTSQNVPSNELCDRVDRVLDRAVDQGFEALEADQAEDLAAFWETADVEVDTDDPRIQQAVRWNLFQLFQASSRAEHTGIPAKGLTGHGYEGHYFWDVEIFVMPFLAFTTPRVAKNLLRFRYGMLDAARERARELDLDGALYPWRTITGPEASAYFQAGTAQYHLNADIAHALKVYVDVTGDTEALGEFGSEILVETARLFGDLGFHSKDDDAFHLHGVTGPDEYTTVVNDNAFTNLMAKQHLEYAGHVLRILRATDPECYEILWNELEMTDDELAAWRRAAATMHIPYDERRGIHPQDEHFLQQEVWDFAATPADKYPLLLNYHPLMIYRYQVIKQADVVLAMFLLGDHFSLEQKRRNYRYYDALTTSDSSLSPPVHAIVASEIGEEDDALEYFRLSLFMDLLDVAGNADQGVHVASTGGVWMALVHGFAGMRSYHGHITFDPRLPSEWQGLRFPLQVRGRSLRVELTHHHLGLELRSGNPLTVGVRGTEVEVTPGEPVQVALNELAPID
ncbi:glycoside hydrolase family 65 protein [Egibacter rhizosphaerae]|uniref:Glycoside hydrolase family 65 protein n=1 Tax=Egibacter rhizosphaerae TaxID=1670831 RepID=A0A411YI79_9ACTN|nr:glycosyl hydrolase family 65 protein [Egibacter rhizosphaerae]QBI20940.1 glycoside hydrolase family 65 protein [Egibacter rhizosphaerae]